MVPILSFRPALLVASMVPLAFAALAHAASPADAPAVDVYHGVRIEDRWRWLEAGDDARVNDWTAGQNARTRTYLDALPNRAAIATQLRALERNATVRDGGFQPAGGKLFATTFDPERQQPRLSVLDESGDPATRRIVFDPASIEPAGHVSIDWFRPSPDGRLIAASLSTDGSEVGTLHLIAVDGGADVEPPIPDVQYPTGGGSLAWTADGRGFWYTRYPGSDVPADERPFNQQVRFHRLGTPASADALVLGGADGVPRTGEIFLDNGAGTPRALASVELGDGGRYRHFLLDEHGARLIADYDAQLHSAALAADGSVVGIALDRSANGAIVRYVPAAHGFVRTTLVAPGRLAIQAENVHGSIVVAGSRVFYGTIDGGPSALHAIGLDGHAAIVISTPPVTAVHLVAALPGGDVLYRVEGYLSPAKDFRWQARDGRSVDTAIASAPSFDTSGFEVRRLFARSKDGTRVPFTVIVPRGFVADGHAPAVLSGYGGFGINLSPGYVRASTIQILNAGGIVATANLRGGGEYGEAWHRGGMLLAKQNVFDDFAAVGQALVDLHYTQHERLAIRGGSNGGLLMGAVLTQHPALAKAVVSTVGIYDMLRVETNQNGAFNTSEYGSVADQAQFKALLAYSPLHHVRDGVTYPAVMLATGDHDGRVDPMHSRKFAAALQAAGDAQVFLRTSANAGHGIGSSLDERQGLEVDLQAFLFDQLGMTVAASSPAP